MVVVTFNAGQFLLPPVKRNSPTKPLAFFLIGITNAQARLVCIYKHIFKDNIISQ